MLNELVILTVVYSVVTPLIWSEAEGDLVVIENSI